jgi:hypothetical protein
MTGMIDTLQSNPAAFLSIVGSTPIYVGDPDFTQAVKSHFDAASPASMFKIVGCDRIAFAALDDTGRNRFDVTITGKANGASQPCYWLPWAKDGAVQIKLKPSKKATPQSLEAHHRPTITASDSSSIQLARDRGAWKARELGDDLDPDLLFTGMMNGCSVWVSGDPAEPLVYHINRASHDNEKIKQLLSEGKDRDKEINRLKSKQMEKDFRAFDASGGSGSGARHGKVTPSTEHLRNPMQGTAAEAAKDGRSKVIRKLVGDGQQAYYIQKNMVTAFGVRINGLWSFYKQDIYEYYLYNQSGTIDRFSAGALRVAATKPEKFFHSLGQWMLLRSPRPARPASTGAPLSDPAP